MKPISLRKYQELAISQLDDEFRKGNRRVILWALMGAGKTTMAAWMIKRSVSCEECYYIFDPDAFEACPECGWEKPKKVRAPEVKRLMKQVEYHISDIKTKTKFNKQDALYEAVQQAYLSQLKLTQARNKYG